MALSNGPNLGLLVNGNQGEAHYAELLRFLRGVDCLVMCSVKDKDLATSPGSPADGDRYIVAAGATGAWAGQTGKLARYSSVQSAWEFYTPKEGWLAYVEDEDALYRHTGTAWEKALGPKAAGWGAPTGTATRTAFDTTTVTLEQLAERLKALIDDLTAHGLIGP